MNKNVFNDKMPAPPFRFLSFFAWKRHEFSIYKFSFCSIARKVCPSKIGFSGNREKNEFAGDENSWFSHKKSSPAPKENTSHFIEFG